MSNVAKLHSETQNICILYSRVNMTHSNKEHGRNTKTHDLQQLVLNKMSEEQSGDMADAIYFKNLGLKTVKKEMRKRNIIVLATKRLKSGGYSCESILFYVTKFQIPFFFLSLFIISMFSLMDSYISSLRLLEIILETLKQNHL